MGILAKLKKLLGEDFNRDLTEEERAELAKKLEGEATEEEEKEEGETSEEEENPSEEATEENKEGSNVDDEEESTENKEGEEEAKEETSETEEETEAEEKPEEEKEESEDAESTETEESSEEEGEALEDEPALEEENTEEGLTDTEETSKVILEEGWYSVETGEVVPEKVHDENVLQALQYLVNERISVINEGLISAEVDKVLAETPIAVSLETFKKLVDFTGVRVEDGKVIGVREAIESLKAQESGIFRDTKKDNNPLNEGFNPVRVKAKPTLANSVVGAIRQVRE